MPTTTEAPAVVEPDAESELAAARAAHAELLERIDADDPVSVDDLVRSEYAVKLAEERVSLLERRAADEAEARRRATLTRVAKSLTEGVIHRQAAAVVTAFDEAVEALAKLHTEAETHNALIRDAWRETSGLGDFPPELNVERGTSTPANFRIAGRHVKFDGQRPAKLLGNAARTAGRDHSVRSAISDGVNGSYPPIDALRKFIEPAE